MKLFLCIFSMLFFISTNIFAKTEKEELAAVELIAAPLVQGSIQFTRAMTLLRICNEYYYNNQTPVKDIIAIEYKEYINEINLNLRIIYFFAFEYIRQEHNENVAKQFIKKNYMKSSEEASRFSKEISTKLKDFEKQWYENNESNHKDAFCASRLLQLFYNREHIDVALNWINSNIQHLNIKFKVDNNLLNSFLYEHNQFVESFGVKIID